MAARRKNGPNTIVLDREYYTSCNVNLHGATVVSWRIENHEQLFVSRHAIFDSKQPIRGGIPFIFPIIGPWKFGPNHGFARIATWHLEKEPEKLKNGDIEATFSLADTDFTRSMWNFQFRILYKLTLCERELHFDVTLENTSKEIPFKFNMLLQTYFRVPDVRNCSIIGLEGCAFVDKIHDNKKGEETEGEITIGNWTDRTYRNTPDELTLTNAINGRDIKIITCNFPDTVIWNPWVERSEELPDFGNDEYPKMVCIKSGLAIEPERVEPGMIFEASLILKMIPEWQHEIEEYAKIGIQVI